MLKEKASGFIYHALPGQEEMNLNLLKERQLVTDIRNWDMKRAEERISAFFQSNERAAAEKQVREYLVQMCDREIGEVLKRILVECEHKKTPS